MPLISTVFIDSRVTGYRSLIDSQTDPVDVFTLDGRCDGLAHMAPLLNGRTGIDAFHVILHGSQAFLYLGNTVLDRDSLTSYESQLACTGGALKQTADLPLYSGNRTQGEAGLQFITLTSHCKAAEIAASTDLTGPLALRGSFVLEAKSAHIEATTLASGAQAGG